MITYQSTPDFYNDYISHHGILGQKWGTRNGPPYPLSAGAHSQSERKAGYTKSIKSSGSKSENKGNSKKKYIRTVDKFGNPILIPIIAWDTFVLGSAAYGIGKAAASAIRTKNLDKRLSKMQKDPKTGLSIKQKVYTDKQDMKLVNPGYNTGRAEYSHNCALCTMTYEMRRRGYDVTANKTTSGITNSDFLKYFDAKKAAPIARRKASDSWGRKVQWQNETKDQHKEYARKVMSEMSKLPNNSRGTINVVWGKSGGHSMVYEIINNKLVIKDCQVNKIYDTDKKLEKLLSTVADTTYIRLDNAKIKTKYIKEVCH